MNTLSSITLDDNWVYLFAEDRYDNFSAADLDVSGWIPLPHLSDWAVASSEQEGSDWFRRTVVLQPTTFCINYELHIEKVPQSASIHINGRFVDEVDSGQGFHRDITEYVALGHNLIAIQLVCLSNTGDGGFGKIRLQPIACE